MYQHEKPAYQTMAILWIIALILTLAFEVKVGDEFGTTRTMMAVQAFTMTFVCLMCAFAPFTQSRRWL